MRTSRSENSSSLQADVFDMHELHVDGFSTRLFESNMNYLQERYGLPPFPGFEDLHCDITWDKPADMTITLRLVDYYSNSRLSKNWSVLRRWLEVLGVRVIFEFVNTSVNNKSQIGASCGVVAARVLTWIRQGSVLGAASNRATTVAVLKHANSLLADANKVPSSFRDTCKTQFLSESAVNILGCNYMLLEAQEQPPPDDIFHMWPFKCVTFDQLLVDIAKSITTAAVSHAPSASYFCANSEGSGSKGFHWVSAILSIDFGEAIAAIPPLVIGVANDDAGHSQLTEACADIFEDGDVITDADEAELSSDDGKDLDSVSHKSFFEFDSDPDIHSDLDLRSDAMINSSSSGDESDNDDIVDFSRQLTSSFDLEHQFSED